MVLMCDECYSVWLSPEIKLEEILYPQAPDYLVDETEAGLVGERAGWASREQVRDRGWDNLINTEDSTSYWPSSPTTH
jgi:hypothetical protein